MSDSFIPAEIEPLFVVLYKSRNSHLPKDSVDNVAKARFQNDLAQHQDDLQQWFRGIVDDYQALLQQRQEQEEAAELEAQQTAASEVATKKRERRNRFLKRGGIFVSSILLIAGGFWGFSKLRDFQSDRQANASVRKGVETVRENSSKFGVFCLDPTIYSWDPSNPLSWTAEQYERLFLSLEKEKLVSLEPVSAAQNELSELGTGTDSTTRTNVELVLLGMNGAGVIENGSWVIYDDSGKAVYQLPLGVPAISARLNYQVKQEDGSIVEIIGTTRYPNARNFFVDPVQAMSSGCYALRPGGLTFEQARERIPANVREGLRRAQEAN